MLSSLIFLHGDTRSWVYSSPDKPQPKLKAKLSLVRFTNPNTTIFCVYLVLGLGDGSPYKWPDLLKRLNLITDYGDLLIFLHHFVVPQERNNFL